MDSGEDISTGSVALVASDEGEFHHFLDEPCRGDHSLLGSVEYIGTIRNEINSLTSPS